MLLYDFIRYKLEDDEGFLPKLVPMLLKEAYMKNYTDHEKEFQDFYFPGISWNDLDEMLPGLEQMLGDIQFRAGVLGTASLLSTHSSTYVMRYAYTQGPRLFTHRHPDPSKAPPLPHKAGHGDEMALILPDLPHTYTPAQEDATTHLLDMVENFAYGRAPREDWPLFNSDTHPTLVFTENGDFKTEPFASPRHTKMLQNIHSYLHHDALERGGGGGGSGGAGGPGGGSKDEL
ncbi:hypothetical protein O3P69_019752 [Scylla paramamosain]|uniref:Carboxylesterase type B domain-containing protein n=1 Tax=Scylla paramamosain TaxID=85552 RepID=A0AAW0SYX6_SCYPA